MKQETTQKAYELARQRYADAGIDTDRALEILSSTPLSMHCWQGDDVGGFETPDAALSGGGIQVTGNYPGKARNVEELRQDIEQAFSLIPGTHRLNLHASYGEFKGKRVDRDAVAPEHFSGWIDWAKEHAAGLDFNGTFFSHPKADSGFTISSKDEAIRSFWIEHALRCREIGAEMGRQLGSPCVLNLWVPDGCKDYTVDRYAYRKLLKQSLDTIFEKDYDQRYLKESIETKLFGIGSEAFVTGSHEFYMNYACASGKMLCIDMGHFHPAESIPDKISSILLFHEELLLHVSRPMRWDSDHIVVLNDSIYELFQEVVRCGGLGRVHVGLDFFDGSLNRVGAWVVGTRAALKGLLFALLEPTGQMRAFEDQQQFIGRLQLQELQKSMPFGAVWDYYCMTKGVVQEDELLDRMFSYEEKVLRGRR